MATYARIENGIIAELLTTSGDIATMFPPELVWVDITLALPQPGEYWAAVEVDGAWNFTAPAVPVGPSLAETKASLCASVDAEADKVYASIGGPSWGRGAEYQQARDDALAFKASGYSGTVPETISCWAQAKSWTDQQATDDILSTATLWESILVAVRSARLIGKSAINDTADAASAEAAAVTAIANVQAAAGA